MNANIVYTHLKGLVKLKLLPNAVQLKFYTIPPIKNKYIHLLYTVTLLHCKEFNKIFRSEFTQVMVKLLL